MRALALVGVLTLAAVSSIDADESCAARAAEVGGAAVRWVTGPQEDVQALQQWCRAVGPPLFVPHRSNRPASPPDLRDLVVLTWNAHLAEGRLPDLLNALRSGALTGAPVQHFVLLVQELYRRGTDVPALIPGVRSAHAIRARDTDAPDVNAYAATLGLSIFYVPSMRNGAALFEDRGNAIISSEPLLKVLSLELPFERQRRVAIGASIDVLRDGVRSTLGVINAHLEPLSSPQSLWFFRNPRTRQVRALLGVLSTLRFQEDAAWAGTVLGGDFNTIKAGADEGAYRAARAWGHSTGSEDSRATHLMGRLDYLFYRLPEGWTGSTARVQEKFGSDHHPVAGRFLP